MNGPGRGRLDPRRGGLRRQTARGTMVNAAFLVGVNTLALLKGFIVVAFIAPEDYGLWGVLTISMGTILWLRQIGISDKYIQQDDDDQQLAFQRAFTLELAFTALFTLLLAIAVPLIALVYGHGELLAPGFVALLAMPAFALHAPLWIFYRRMEFVRQRTLQAIDPIVSFVVTIGACAAGAGYWGLLAGAIAGPWAAALVAVRASPYPLRLRWDGASLREYASFSWPLALTSGAGIVLAQGTVLAGEAELGLAGVGAITLASGIVQYADRVDQIITQTMYPAMTSVKERIDLLYESFVKSNRLTLMWGAPFGVGIALFAADLVHFVLGDKWRGAIGLLQAFGLIAAVNHIAFNWSAFYKARGDTRPAAVISLVLITAFFGAVLPGILIWGLDGLAGGMAILVTASMAARLHYVRRLFPDFHVVRYAIRGLAPTVPAAAVVLAVRALEWTDRTGAVAAGELVLFVAVCAAFTVLFERPLLREALGYLGRPSGAVPAP